LSTLYRTFWSSIVTQKKLNCTSGTSINFKISTLKEDVIAGLIDKYFGGIYRPSYSWGTENRQPRTMEHAALSETSFNQFKYSKIRMLMDDPFIAVYVHQYHHEPY